MDGAVTRTLGSRTQKQVFPGKLQCDWPRAGRRCSSFIIRQIRLWIQSARDSAIDSPPTAFRLNGRKPPANAWPGTPMCVPEITNSRSEERRVGKECRYVGVQW